MKTYKRIDKITESVELAYNTFLSGEIVACDIATDHGYIAESLIKKDYVKNVVATDISAKSLKKLQNLIEFHHIFGINCVLGDGLTVIDSADICVIAGIGGEEIVKMLSLQNKRKNGENKCNVFVLQPAQNVIELRKFIFKNKIYLLKDFVIEDEGRFYPILIIDVSKRQRNKQNIFNIWLGRDNKNGSEDFVKYIGEINEYLEFLNEIPYKRIRKDKVLKQKYKLKKLASKLI